MSATERIEIQRTIAAPPEAIFAIISDPEGHVTIDSTGMLMSSTGSAATAVGDTFTIHMDREALGDYDLGKYDVEVQILTFEQDREISWTIEGKIKPSIGHVYGYRLEPVDEGTLVTSFYDWSNINDDWKKANIFPVISELAVKATLGILDRTVQRNLRRSA
ncbi:MAG TPA: SRPBCC family protein [Ilumatobacter sp.]|nr:SRPBCC family protein [Ilumatobacter sp.]